MSKEQLSILVAVFLFFITFDTAQAEVTLQPGVTFNTTGTNTTYIAGTNFTLDRITITQDSINITKFSVGDFFMSVTPSIGLLNATILQFNDSYKRWNESATNASASIQHVIGSFSANGAVIIRINGSIWSIFTSDASGRVSFVYNGGNSGMQFEAVLDTSATNNSNNNNGNTGGQYGGGGGGITTTTKTITITLQDPLIKIIVSLKQSLDSPSLIVAKVLSVPVPAPKDSVYQYINITTSKFNNTHVENATIDFRVNKSWILLNNFTRIWLARYDNGWNKLKTDLVNSTATTNYYRAYMDAFSYFAIIGEKAAQVSPPAPEPLKKQVREEPAAEQPETLQNASIAGEPKAVPYTAYAIATVILIIAGYVVIYGAIKKKADFRSEAGASAQAKVEPPHTHVPEQMTAPKVAQKAKPSSNGEGFDDIEKRLDEIRRKLRE